MGIFAIAAFFLFMQVVSMGDPVIGVGDIVRPGDGERLQEVALWDHLRRHPIVLVGESHDDAHHHAVQHRVIEAMVAAGGEVAVGMEMFPQSLQPILDLWSTGGLGEAEFLDATTWYFTWNFPAELYLPILRLVREHHLPLVALNTERSLIKRVRTSGLASLDEGVRRTLPLIAPAPPDYRQHLQAVFASHPMMAKTGDITDFIAAQSLWDAVMAQAIADWLQRHPRGRMVALTGAGHLLMKHGIPHQLAARGLRDATVTLLPWNVRDPVPGGAADLVWGTPPPSEVPELSRLGVTLETPPGARNGVFITAVTPDSPAAAVGLRIGDRPLLLDDVSLPIPHTLVRLLRDRNRNPRPTLTFLRGDLRMTVVPDLTPGPS
ncbi:MAG: ChaN family lipoprotein [Magnetococcales bacterium]|nr:ChaN family lipoprotein [Magnetococcales bacterium]